MEKLTKLSAKVGLIVGILTICGIVISAWAWVGFPPYASAMSVEKLEKKHVVVGKRVYAKDEHDIIKDLRKLKRELRRTKNEKDQADIEDEIDDLDLKLRDVRIQIKAYNDRLIELGD